MSKPNNLAVLYPGLIRQWDYEKNNGLTPQEVTAGSQKKVYWICEKGHSFDMDIRSRTKGQGCPYCNNRRILPGYNLIPKEFRQMAELESGDIVKLSMSSGKIVVSKVDIVEMGSQDPQAVEAYVNAAVKHMSPAKQVALAARILKFAQQEGGTDC